jgi:hypothetical protein
MIRRGVAGSVFPAEPAFAPVSVSGIGSVREGRRRRCASADCIAANRVNSASPITTRFMMTPGHTIALF